MEDNRKPPIPPEIPPVPTGQGYETGLKDNWVILLCVILFILTGLDGLFTFLSALF